MSGDMRGFLKDVLDGKVREVRKWIEKGENVSQYDEYGNTALHLAAEKGFRGVCKVLLDAGADVNQRNTSVGWSAVHYAAYEGHIDVLRMLLAHGAIPDIRDKSGDTPESYAAEWENSECVMILREATAAKQEANREMSVMFDDSEDNDDSDDDDDDESSMMNWIMPPPSVPNNNNNTTATVQQPQNESPANSLHVSVHLQPPAPQKKVSDASSDLSLPDLSVDHLHDHLNGNDLDGDSDTESEDTMKLMQESAAIKTYKDSRSPNRTTNNPGAMSIVDKIKNNLQNSKVEQEAQERIKQVNILLLYFVHEFIK